jgi:hypothetical protein
MTVAGIKGKSGGKATTAEEKAKKSAASRARETRRAKALAIKGKLGDPVTYGDLLKSVQVDGELTQNERRAVEVERAEVELSRARDERDLARGLLKTKVEFRESVTAIVEEIVSRLSILVDAAVETHPPEQQPRIRHLMESAAYKLRDEVRARLKEKTT